MQVVGVRFKGRSEKPCTCSLTNATSKQLAMENFISAHLCASGLRPLSLLCLGWKPRGGPWRAGSHERAAASSSPSWHPQAAWHGPKHVVLIAPLPSLPRLLILLAACCCFSATCLRSHAVTSYLTGTKLRLSAHGDGTRSRSHDTDCTTATQSLKVSK